MERNVIVKNKSKEIRISEITKNHVVKVIEKGNIAYMIIFYNGYWNVIEPNKDQMIDHWSYIGDAIEDVQLPESEFIVING